MIKKYNKKIILVYNINRRVLNKLRIIISMNVNKYNYKRELINSNNNQQNIQIKRNLIKVLYKNQTIIKYNKNKWLIIMDQNKISIWIK